MFFGDTAPNIHLRTGKVAKNMHRVNTVLYSENREMLASGAEFTTILNIIDNYL